MQPIFSIKLPAKLQYPEQLIDFVANSAGKMGVERKRVGEIRVAAEEALVNVANYAYRGCEGAGEVEVVCRLDDENNFVTEIIDSGSPFDFSSIKDPDTTLDVSERNIGGLGIYLIKKLMEYVEHRREDDKNILTLKVSKKNKKKEGAV